MARSKAKAEASERGVLTSTLGAPTEQNPKTHDEKVAASEARRAEMQKDPTRR